MSEKQPKGQQPEITINTAFVDTAAKKGITPEQWKNPAVRTYIHTHNILESAEKTLDNWLAEDTMSAIFANAEEQNELRRQHEEISVTLGPQLGDRLRAVSGLVYAAQLILEDNGSDNRPDNPKIRRPSLYDLFEPPEDYNELHDTLTHAIKQYGLKVVVDTEQES